MGTVTVYAAAALAEIGGCFAVWGWRRLGWPAWVLLPGALSLAAFALLLTLSEASAAGRAYAAYGGIYVAASLAWLWAVEGRVPDAWDLGGTALCLVGAGVILWGGPPGR